MIAEDLGFNEEFIEMVELMSEKYSFLQAELTDSRCMKFEEWLLKNIEEVKDNLFDGWTDREKYLFAYALAGNVILSCFE